MTDIQINHDDIYRGNLVLINDSYAIIQNMQPVLLPLDAANCSVSMEINAARILSNLMETVNCKEVITPVSGYRSPTEQSRIYNESLTENGAEYTRRYVALPYHSEHHTGLAIDLALGQEDIDIIQPYFPYDGICNELRRMAPLYGFIERYPKGKEDITGIAHEPWHFRYVGFPHSKIITEQGITLEEYIDQLRSFPYEGNHLYIEHRNQLIEIFYLCLLDAVNIRIGMNECIFHQVSGNNVDGVIVTVWRKNND